MKKLLFITSADLNKKYNNGGEYVCQTNLRLLKDIYGEENIYVCFFSENPSTLSSHFYSFPRIRKLKALVAQMLGYKMYFPWKEKEILNYINVINPDIIFLDGILCGSLLRKIPSHIKKIVFEHNFEKHYYKMKLKHEGWIYLFEYLAVSKNEKIAIGNCDSLICISERDKKAIYEAYQRNADLVLPVSFDDRYVYPEEMYEKYNNTLTFIGSNFGPNYEGILWFVNEVMSELSEYHLFIVGKNFEKNRNELQRSNVTVVGTVDNLEEFYYQYSPMVIPIFYGSGMKVKTAEAMMYGKNIFATDEALEGYNVENLGGIYRCNTKEDFIKNIQSNCNSSLPYFNKEVHDFYLENYSYEAVYKKMKQILVLGD